MEIFRCLWPWTLLLHFMLGSQSLARESDQPGSEPPVGQFTLFGESPDGDSATEQETREANRRRRAADSDEPEFTLLGTSRIGDRYSAILRHRDGTEIVVVSSGGRETSISGYEQYAMLEVNAGQVSIRFPDEAVCVESSDAGVKCRDDGIATLELTVGTPLTLAVIAGRLDDIPGPASVDFQPPPESQARTLNPGQNPQRQSIVARLTDKGRTGDPQTPRRIDPADVPPGMKIVAKPSGDLLVPED
jgi:hypothetical protein